MSEAEPTKPAPEEVIIKALGRHATRIDPTARGTHNSEIQTTGTIVEADGTISFVSRPSFINDPETQPLSSSPFKPTLN